MIKPIVEGHGEVEALPLLLRRIAGECFGIWDPPILKPGRYPASQMLRRKDGTWVPGPGFAKAAGHVRYEGLPPSWCFWMPMISVPKSHLSP